MENYRLTLNEFGFSVGPNIVYTSFYADHLASSDSRSRGDYIAHLNLPDCTPYFKGGDMSSFEMPNERKWLSGQKAY